MSSNLTDMNAMDDSADRGGPAQPLLIVRNLKKYFPVRGGLLEREKKFVHAVDGINFGGQRQDAGHRRRIRLWQVDDGSADCTFDGARQRHFDF